MYSSSLEEEDAKHSIIASEGKNTNEEVHENVSPQKMLESVFGRDPLDDRVESVDEGENRDSEEKLDVRENRIYDWARDAGIYWNMRPAHKRNA